MHDQCAIRAEREWSAGCDVEYCRQCDGKSADSGVERYGRDFASDYFDCAGRIFERNDGVGRDGGLRIDDYRRSGSDGDGAVGMCAVVGADYVQRDTGVGDVERRDDGGGVCDSDVLPRSDDFDGICGARGRSWRRAWIAAGFASFRRSDVDVPGEPARGFDVCDVAAGGAGVGGLQQ